MYKKNNIQVSDLSKSYKKNLALNNLSFEVDATCLYGVIGPDGAGKTTLFRILATLLLPDSGKVFLNNYDVVCDYKKIRNSIGYMPGRFSLYQDLTIEENLNFFATIFGTTIKENYHLIKDIYIQIEPFKKRKAGMLSGGMKQKLALCCALIHKPEILLLDEPTTGVDAVSRKEFWEMLRNLQTNGITILVSTPYMDEASLCDKIALMNKGNILSIDNPIDIIKKFPKQLLSIKAKNNYKLLLDLREFPSCENAYPFGQYIHYIDEANTDLAKIDNFIKSKNNEIEFLKFVNPTIEDCFMYQMKNQ